MQSGWHKFFSPNVNLKNGSTGKRPGMHTARLPDGLDR